MFVSKTSLPVGVEILLYGLGYSGKSQGVCKSDAYCCVMHLQLILSFVNPSSFF